MRWFVLSVLQWSALLGSFVWAHVLGTELLRWGPRHGVPSGSMWLFTALLAVGCGMLGVRCWAHTEQLRQRDREQRRKPRHQSWIGHQR